MPRIPAPAERIKWFNQARFGLFIHWGLYSLLGRGEWVMWEERIPVKEWALLAGRFQPKKFNPHAWAKLAKEAGMKYVMLTARHHDGFCLWDSKVSNFTSVKTAAKRDFIAEYVKAMRSAGLKVGLYYSLKDWRFPGYFKYVEESRSLDAMREQAHAQVRELLTNYGKIDVLWYDGQWLNHDVRTNQHPFWLPEKLEAMVRRLQPHILFNNRSGVPGDFETQEQKLDDAGEGRPWESCMTIGDPWGWGYLQNCPNRKTVPHLLHNMLTAASKSGNFLLNVGPTADGVVPAEEANRLRTMGAWLRKNGESYYGSERGGLSGATNGVWTRKGKNYYFHIFRWYGGTATVALTKGKVKSACILATGRKVKWTYASNGRIVFYGMPVKPPDPYVTTLKVEFAGTPERYAEKDIAAWLEGKA